MISQTLHFLYPALVALPRVHRNQYMLFVVFQGNLLHNAPMAYTLPSICKINFFFIYTVSDVFLFFYADLQESVFIYNAFYYELQSFRNTTKIEVCCLFVVALFLFTICLQICYGYYRIHCYSVSYNQRLIHFQSCEPSKMKWL